MEALWNIVLLSVAVFLVAKLLPAVHIKSGWTAIIVAVVYSLINFLVGWLLTFISLPAIVITFGLFYLVINTILLWATDKVLDDFKIDSFLWTFIAAVLITACNWLLQMIF